MESEVSLSCSQEPATGPYRETNELSFTTKHTSITCTGDLMIRLQEKTSTLLVIAKDSAAIVRFSPIILLFKSEHSVFISN
jgi:hypothetical protein